jgi:hypothetical protein
MKHLVESKVDKVYIVLENATSLTERDRVFQWLSPSIRFTNHFIALQQRHAGTGQWFIEGKAFTSFIDRKTPCLWLHGIPGCGRTVLSSTVIGTPQQFSSSPPAILIYFDFDFIDFNDSRKQTLDTNRLRQVNHQLLEQLRPWAGC